MAVSSLCDTFFLSKYITVQCLHYIQTLAEESVSLASSTPYKSKVKRESHEEIVVCCVKDEESELEEGELQDSKVTNASFHEYTFKSTSWVELLDDEDSKEMQVCVCVAYRTVKSTFIIFVYFIYTKFYMRPFLASLHKKRPPNVKISAPDTNDSQSQASYERQITIEILDASNEAKFDRLLKEDKLKSPFRRHPSNEVFDEASKAQLMKHDPSILDFKVAMSSPPSTVVRTISAESDTACDGFGFPQQGSVPGASTSTNSPGKRKRDTENQKEELDDVKKPRFAKFRSESTSSSEQSYQSRRPELETDPGILERRQKQIDYGKNTIGYDNYIQAVPKEQREPHHPRTPKKHMKYSRRAWDGLVRQWRIQLHKYDPNAKALDEDDEQDEKTVFHY